MTVSEYSKSIIATACWRAAPTELHQVMLSVGMVFMNRAAAESKDLYEVAVEYLTQNPGEFPDTRDPQFQSLISKLDGVTSGLVTDKTAGALYFLHKDQLQPDMLEAFSITTTIGNLIFVK